MIDIEADGLLHKATQMHCLVAKDIDTGEVYKFHSGNKVSDGYPTFPWMEDALQFLNRCTTIIAHNGLTFDLPFLKKMYGWEPKPEVIIIDTLVMSRHLNPDRPRVEGVRAGPHSVEAWGMRLGRWKPDHTDWSVFSMEMLHRCAEDVEIQCLIYQRLQKEADIINPSYSIFDSNAYGPNDWSQAMWNEHESAKIMHIQEENGCYFNTESATNLLEILEDYIGGIEDDILAEVPPTPKQKGVSLNAPFKKNGDYTKAVMDWFDTDCDLVSGPFSRVEWNVLNLGSDKQVKAWLDGMGWVPTQWNYSKNDFDEAGKPLRTSPKLTPDSFDSLPTGLGDKLKRRSMASHRRSQITGWVGHVREDHRIAASANPQGTPTGRMRHRVVANVPKASSDKETHELLYFPKSQPVFLGTEMRDLFRAAPGKVLVGRDAAGIELRCFAHYINDPVYTDVILNGDVHTHNQEMAGLSTRDQAKTFNTI